MHRQTSGRSFSWLRSLTPSASFLMTYSECDASASCCSFVSILEYRNSQSRWINSERTPQTVICIVFTSMSWYGTKLFAGV